MKSYTITVNGNIYDVEVEEKNGAATTQSAPVAAAPVKAAAPAPKKASTGAAGGVTVNSPMPGKILAVKANEGASVKKGDVLILLEAMKMENEIVAPQDGTVASINVSTGDMVEAGDVLASMN